MVNVAESAQAAPFSETTPVYVGVGSFALRSKKIDSAEKYYWQRRLQEEAEKSLGEINGRDDRI